MNDTYEKQMYWKNVRSKKLEEEGRKLFLKENEECTFTPQLYSSHKKEARRRARAPKIELPIYPRNNDDQDDGSDDSLAISEVQILSDFDIDGVKLHVSRQELARKRADDMTQRFKTGINKNYDVVTKPQPFNLSTSNKGKKTSIEGQYHLKKKSVKIKNSSGNPTLSISNPALKKVKEIEANSTSDLYHDKFIDLLDQSGKSMSDVNSWVSERASLISMIEAQRIELKQREQAQSDATKIAKRFSAAILAFEDRLVQMEQDKHKEIDVLQKQMHQQMDWNEKLLSCFYEIKHSLETSKVGPGNVNTATNLDS